MAAINPTTLPPLAPPVDPRAAQMAADRAALTKAGNTVSQSALAGILGGADIMTMVPRAVGSAVNQVERPFNAFGANLPAVPDNATISGPGGYFPQLNAYRDSLNGPTPAAPVATATATATPVTAPAAKPTVPTAAIPAQDPLIKQTITGSLPGPTPAPVVPALSPIQTGINQQQAYRDQNLAALDARVAAGNPDNRSARLHALGGAYANALGTNNFAGLNEAQAQAAGTNATQLAATQLQTEQQQRTALINADAINRQSMVHQTGAMPIDPNNPLLGSVPTYSVFQREGDAPLKVVPIGTQAGKAAQSTSAPTEGATGNYQGKKVIYKAGKWQYNE